MHDNYRKRVKSKLKLVWTTLLILSTFTLSWGLCVLYFVLVCIDGCIFIYRLSVSFQVGFLLNSTVNFLVMLKLVFNPLIYALRMKHIRKSVLLCLRMTCLRPLKLNSSITNGNTNNGGNTDRKISRNNNTNNHSNNNHTIISRSCSDSNNLSKRYCKVSTIEETVDNTTLHRDRNHTEENIQLLDIKQNLSTISWDDYDSDA